MVLSCLAGCSVSCVARARGDTLGVDRKLRYAGLVCYEVAFKTRGAFKTSFAFNERVLAQNIKKQANQTVTV